MLEHFESESEEAFDCLLKLMDIFGLRTMMEASAPTRFGLSAVFFVLTY
jgi:hypothetical protein